MSLQLKYALCYFLMSSFRQMLKMGWFRYYTQILSKYFKVLIRFARLGFSTHTHKIDKLCGEIISMGKILIIFKQALKFFGTPGMRADQHV